MSRIKTEKDGSWKCPKCGIWNVGTEAVCDCGYSKEEDSIKGINLWIVAMKKAYPWGIAGFAVLFIAARLIFPVTNEWGAIPIFGLGVACTVVSSAISEIVWHEILKNT